MKPISTTAKQAERLMPRKMTMREIETEVSKSGNGAHVFVPKDWLGKKVRVTVLDEDEDKPRRSDKQ